MTTQPPSTAAERTLAVMAVAAAWSCYLPLGIKYATVLACALCAALMLLRDRPSSPLQWTSATKASAALPALLALSALWSPAPAAKIITHLWLYALPLLVPLIASACPPTVAQRGLRHFALASALVGLLFVLARTGLLPASPLLWDTTVDAEGNQRIATSILLALGAGSALWFALQAHSFVRVGWWLAMVTAATGLSLQDRRSGMLLLPVLLLAWALVRQSSGWRRLGMCGAIVVAAAVVWQVGDGVRARFHEGLAELRQYQRDDDVATSWGQRLRMWERTAGMVMERPFAGHGVASWQGLWRERIKPGTALAEHTTPHDEYLLITQQVGMLGLGLWVWLLVASWRSAVSAGAAGVPSLLVWSAIAWTGLFNAVLRDAKFALPLLLLAALAGATARTGRTAQRPSDTV